MKKIIIIMPILFFLTACGQSGNLYLPPQQHAAPQQKAIAKRQKNIQQQ